MAENGNSNAVRVYSRELGWSVPESSVRHFEQAYFKNLQVVRNPDEVQLRKKLRRHPLNLRCLDSLVQDYVKHPRLSGGIVSRSIVVAAARGIVKHHDHALLTE